ncbi:MAG: hypothetical protein KJ981_07080 [Alphaproteobacteria bacterium]|nr:hypothetical protein [Alphaproteobacteria bacterium]MBU0834818.1 hypothetical protein [Alphaproteobacteria bacterium]MBU1763649.1 hypothetical protein [Alphaproteobacteria bacterium]
MARLSRLFLSTTAILAISGILLLSGDRYDWMPGLDPTIDPSGIETDGSRALVRTLLLAAALVASAMMALTTNARTRGERLLPLVLSLAALAAYAVGGA